MESVKPKYDKEEFARRGEELFNRDIREKVECENPEKYVAIDIETGDYELDDELLDAVHRLRGRNPEAQVWIRCVGSRSIMRLG